MPRTLDPAELDSALRAARARTLALTLDLDDAQWRVPQQNGLNPFLWELGHIGWFMEHWCLRWHGAGQPLAAPGRIDADRLYDSSRVPHATRWSLPLPGRAETCAELARVLDATLARLRDAEPTDAGLYVYRLALYHEDMHAEAFAYMRQTAGLPAPPAHALVVQAAPAATDGDVQVPGGRAMLGSAPDAAGFAFDNEKWAHEVTLAPFAVSRALVNNAQFAAFVDDGGYARATCWRAAGNAWRQQTQRAHPVYWRRTDDGWQERRFDRWLPLDPAAPVRHVNAHEAEAWCTWAARRLPTEAELEYAWRHQHIAPAGLWEWTASDFLPYPGFSPDPYAEYSAPWFGTHRSVRGASFATVPRLIQPAFRNFYLPERADFFVGFRSCGR
jgi:iron(II)-dependent oxidoreductase